MRTGFGLFAVFSLFILVANPAFADVTSLELGRIFYTDNESMAFIGTQDGKEAVYVVIKNPSGNFKGMLSDPTPEQGLFSVIPRPVSSFFVGEGIYNATAFTDTQKVDNGITIKIQYDNGKISVLDDFVLALKTISDKTVKVGKTVSFTASLTDNTIEGTAFRLNGAAPAGAAIDPDSGKFVWTVAKSQGNIQDVLYSFDVIATKGAQEDRENVVITVQPAYVKPEPQQEPTQQEPTQQEPAQQEPEPPVAEPKELQIPAPFVDKTRDPQSYVDRYTKEAGYKKWFDGSYPEYDSIYHAVGLEEPLAVPAPFVDKTRDPQSYVDRYTKEAGYKKWFDGSYPEYDSIYHAVGLEEPKGMAPFVDPNIDPQHYIDRYNNEAAYKEWFDETYPDITIYDAVGLDEAAATEEPEFGECGKGTDLVDGVCVIVESSKGGGCLIATATYGSEMAPQVQQLREIRDSQLMNTESGVSFMTGFNQLYYSFSPYIADMERESPVFREMVRIGITPLLSSLSIMEYAESDSKVLGYGIAVILMNIGMYLAAPAIIIFKARKYAKIWNQSSDTVSCN